MSDDGWCRVMITMRPSSSESAVDAADDGGAVEVIELELELEPELELELELAFVEGREPEMF